MDLLEKALCRKTASTFELAGKEGYPVALFTRLWFSSSHAAGLYKYDLYSIAQSPLFQLNSLLMEFPELGPYKNTEMSYESLMYWAGYTIAYWLFQEKLSWRKFASKYDWELFLRNYSCLHTVSTDTAISIGQQEYLQQKTKTVAR